MGPKVALEHHGGTRWSSMWTGGRTRSASSRAEPLLVPGSLRTDDYIRAIMAAPGVPSGEIAARGTTRIGRREVVTKQDPAKLLVLLGRAALNQSVGGRQVMVGRLAYLPEMATRPNIEIRITPTMSAGIQAGAFTLIEKNGRPGRDVIIVT